MLINLTDLSEEPLQGQITRQIRAKILASEILPEYELPSIRELARNERISVITVQRAYEILEREGLIHSRRGKGFFVTEIKENRKKDIAIQRFIEKLEPLLTAAISEGMSQEEIKTTINKIIDKIKNRK